MPFVRAAHFEVSVAHWRFLLLEEHRPPHAKGLVKEPVLKIRLHGRVNRVVPMMLVDLHAIQLLLPLDCGLALLLARRIALPSLRELDMAWQQQPKHPQPKPRAASLAVGPSSIGPLLVNNWTAVGALAPTQGIYQLFTSGDSGQLYGICEGVHLYTSDFLVAFGPDWVPSQAPTLLPVMPMD